MEQEQRNFSIKYQMKNAMQVTIAMLVIALFFVFIVVSLYRQNGFDSNTIAMSGVAMMLILMSVAPFFQAKYNCVSVEGDVLTYFDLFSIPQKKTILLSDIEGAGIENNHGVQILVVKDKIGKVMRIAVVMLEEEGAKKLLKLLARLTGQG